MIKAITFDLWDTLVIDDSDELDRAKAGLQTKIEARKRLFLSSVTQACPDRPSQEVLKAYDDMNAWFNKQWHGHNETPHIRDRLIRGLKPLELHSDEVLLSGLTAAFAQMEVDYPPAPAPGVRACLEALKGHYALGIVSDAIVTPGSHLRKLLDRHGLLQFFDVFIFSDEAGNSKPSTVVFEQACAAFGGISPAELVHIGDREERDIAGALAYGAKAVLYTGVKARLPAEQSLATAHCAHLDELATLVSHMG